MRKPSFDDSWPDSWIKSYRCDCEEVFGPITNPGYAYAYQERRRHTIELLEKIARPPASVLDVASAQGNFALTLTEMGYTVVWNDLRAGLIDYVKLKHERGALEFAPGNILELGLQDRFDVVLITEVIEHVAHPDRFLAEIARIVKPGGHIVMTTPNGTYFKNRLPKFFDYPNPSDFEESQFKPDSDGHIFVLHLDEIETLAQRANLCVVETRVFTNPLTNGHVKLHRLLSFLPKRVVSCVEWLTTLLPMFLKLKLHTGMAVLFHRPLRDQSEFGYR